MQLLAAFVDRYPELLCSGEVCLDCGYRRLELGVGRVVRLDESQIQALDLKQATPGADLSWFSHRRALPNNAGWQLGDSVQDHSSSLVSSTSLCPSAFSRRKASSCSQRLIGGRARLRYGIGQ